MLLAMVQGFVAAQLFPLAVVVVTQIAAQIVFFKIVIEYTSSHTFRFAAGEAMGKNFIVGIWDGNKEIVIQLCVHILRFGLLLLVLCGVRWLLGHSNLQEKEKDILLLMDFATNVVLIGLFAGELIIKILYILLRRK